METLTELEFIDLLSERHHRLRKKLDQMWNENGTVPISNSEWFIISKIYRKKITIPELTKRMNIARQATHKLVKNLETKELVLISNHEHNRKLKCIELTKLGEECYEQYIELKKDIVQTLKKKIGEENVASLQKLLSSDWGI